MNPLLFLALVGQTRSGKQRAGGSISGCGGGVDTHTKLFGGGRGKLVMTDFFSSSQETLPWALGGVKRNWYASAQFGKGFEHRSARRQVH